MFLLDLIQMVLPRDVRNNTYFIKSRFMTEGIGVGRFFEGYVY